MDHSELTENGGRPDGAGLPEGERPNGSGLRERSKARRRAAIIRAAFTLFAERGYQATTIADIAAAAEVAPRTVAMYFPSKQDIAMARFSATVDSLTGAMRAVAPGQSITEAIGRWLRAYQAAADRELTELALRMFAANPELNALRSTRMAAIIAEGADLVAHKTGAAPASPGPRIASVAAAAILLELLDFPPGPRREEAITAAMRFLDAGIAALGTAASTTDRSDPAGLAVRHAVRSSARACRRVPAARHRPPGNRAQGPARAGHRAPGRDPRVLGLGRGRRYRVGRRPGGHRSPPGRGPAG